MEIYYKYYNAEFLFQRHNTMVLYLDPVLAAPPAARVLVKALGVISGG